jgi:GNAT superfamily N-acetyltransferase
MKPEIRIRAATLEDIDTIIEVETDAGQRFRDVNLGWVADLPGVTAESIKPIIEASGVLIAESTKTPNAIGFIALTKLDDGAFIIEISTRMDATGQGIGRQLMDAADEWARGQSLPYIALTTFEKVPFNGPWYERLGFSITEPDVGHKELAEAIEGERDSVLGKEPRIAMIKHL